jgi:hypothetical protein
MDLHTVLSDERPYQLGFGHELFYPEGFKFLIAFKTSGSPSYFCGGGYSSDFPNAACR